MGAPPAFVQLDPTSLQSLAITADKQGYDASDADYAKRFPDLVNARNNSIATAASDLSGNQDPIFNQAFQQSGLGNINLGNQFQQAKNLGKPILSQEQRNRTYFQDLFKENPERSFGLSSSDVAHVALANSGNKTSYDNAVFGSRINQINANAAQSQQQTQAIAQGAGSLVNAGIKALTPSYTSVNNNPYILDSGNSFANPTGYTTDAGVYYPPTTVTDTGGSVSTDTGSTSGSLC